ncbi:MAG: bifunctional phosphopantothenoylcysteine decarboxylase/phosphopantothenate--cysteine ligase CoaBC [Desulfobacterota bacterium]|jgi:phosphopantothenoylcysteine decarboxylase/phosphopantothenate--cysteine ligase|nr:bifunctional phosphopantothenoylcysteine decarboxylase/phosphopantothenate--cysteine ligase CoaBC [Thermodesulfobacteriota bacterium]
MKGKKVLVGVTGGIAAYKTAELVRLLVKEGALTKVAMTRHATRFITPLTMETLSGNRVVADMWDPETRPLDHITWGQESDLIILAPATANFIGKMAHGIGDDFLSTVVIAATARILVCPSMNTQMFLSQAVQENLRILRARGYEIMEPGSGELACHTEGPGRLPEAGDIVEEARRLLSRQDLSGLRVLVTAGATLEALDPVRYMSNRSSGKMGYALARAARLRGAKVTLVSGPTALKPPRGVALSCVKTAEEMRQAVLADCQQVDVIIKAAAVLDWRPKETAAHKIKKGRGTQTLELVENPDILAELGCSRGNRRCVLAGFAAETQDLLANAQEKLQKKNLDLIVVNDVSRVDAGFEADTNAVKILYRDGRIEELPLMPKPEVADQLLDRIKVLWEKSS